MLILGTNTYYHGALILTSLLSLYRDHLAHCKSCYSHLNATNSHQALFIYDAPDRLMRNPKCVIPEVLWVLHLEYLHLFFHQCLCSVLLHTSLLKHRWHEGLCSEISSSVSCDNRGPVSRAERELRWAFLWSLTAEDTCKTPSADHVLAILQKQAEITPCKVILLMDSYDIWFGGGKLRSTSWETDLINPASQKALSHTHAFCDIDIHSRLSHCFRPHGASKCCLFWSIRSVLLH